MRPKHGALQSMCGHPWCTQLSLQHSGHSVPPHLVHELVERTRASLSSGDFSMNLGQSLSWEAGQVLSVVLSLSSLKVCLLWQTGQAPACFSLASHLARAIPAESELDLPRGDCCGMVAPVAMTLDAGAGQL